ncbi:MAG: folylpolyglutamate synthase [Heterodermia speciosa]|uniref:Dihydrofolate synthetase n=1 Tax=Heterodermia speciosa TaxID=116794 RepID=A0A8H3I8Z9_9LECA|nr:MAG: folylpolyglutamate synthase [Heterodermia speciosa]
MINFGLSRISRLLESTVLPWRAIHVAGTNGKGSVCAYVSAMLNAGGIPVGRFTSPHLIDRWDCITINEKTVAEDLFLETEQKVKNFNLAADIGASEFELLTATAFTLFAQQKIKIGVVEVGMGGAEDATNVIQDPLVTVITKIGLDHQAFLGNTVEDIARTKAGILKRGIPCVVDGTNTQQVLASIHEKAIEKCAGALFRVPLDGSEKLAKVWDILSKDDYEHHQQTHIMLAYEALSIALNSTQTISENLQLLPAVRNTVWPGRLQTVSIKDLTGRAQPILLDGAHNVQAAEVLDSYVNRRVRLTNDPVTWVIAVSSGKGVQDVLTCLLKPHDRVIACEFGAVSGMPWVQPVKAKDIVSVANILGLHNASVHERSDAVSALGIATRESQGGPIVVAGSLYLVSDILRAIRAATNPKSG